jgi:hypothetical protein
MNIYRLNEGPSPDGAAVHPVDHVADFPDLGAAKAEAERIAGRPLVWAWREDRKAWRALTGHDEAAEIEPCRKLSGISVNVGMMP